MVSKEQTSAREWLVIVDGLIPMLKPLLKAQRGFTLVEMAVVIAILGVLAAVATPLLVIYLGRAEERAYNADLGIVQTAVDAFFSDPNNARFQGKNQYPILGRGETNRTGHTVRCKLSTAEAGCVVDSFDHPDDGTPLTNSIKADGGSAVNRDWNPLGGTQGADLLLAGVAGSTKIAWTDDLDGVREIQVGAATVSPDKWTTMEVTREGVTYYVDPR
jgi:prepilin-type N-terminal cleavage/methylation domain-containing protein